MKLRNDTMELHFTGWFGFWIFMTVWICIEAWQFNNGYETTWWKHKTPEEKQIQQHKIDQLKNKGPVV